MKSRFREETRRHGGRKGDGAIFRRGGCGGVGVAVIKPPLHTLKKTPSASNVDTSLSHSLTLSLSLFLSFSPLSLSLSLSLYIYMYNYIYIYISSSSLSLSLFRSLSLSLSLSFSLALSKPRPCTLLIKHPLQAMLTLQNYNILF